MNKSDRAKLGRAWNLIEAARLIAEKNKRRLYRGQYRRMSFDSRKLAF